MCISKNLVAATKAGNLHQAMAIIKNQPIMVVNECMLKAGFSSVGISDKKAFWEDVQTSLVEACKRRTDGFGLREVSDVD